jgi:hypothetical protein
MSRRLAKEGRLYDSYRDAMTLVGDNCTAGLNYRTLRPRRDIYADYRNTVAQVYEPKAFFGRVRTIGRLVRQPRYKAARIPWRNVPRDLRSVLRLCWAMTVKHPELARHFWPAVYDCLRHHPAGIEAVLRNVIAYLHLYPFSRFLVATIDARIAELDRGAWVEPDPMPAVAATCPAPASPLRAVA